MLEAWRWAILVLAALALGAVTGCSGSVEEADLHGAVGQWKGQFDLKEGGMKGAPKFPMPVNLELLLHYGYLYQDPEISTQKP